jgi:hypothetical protein
MNTMDTDPSNTNKDKENLAQLRTVLLERVATVNQPPLAATTPAPEETDAASDAEKPADAPLKLEPPGAWGSFWYDVQNYRTLPTRPGWRRFYYVMTRNNRIKWFFLLIIVVMIIGFIFHMIRK